MDGKRDIREILPRKEGSDAFRSQIQYSIAASIQQALFLMYFVAGLAVKHQGLCSVAS